MIRIAWVMAGVSLAAAAMAADGVRTLSPFGDAYTVGDGLLGEKRKHKPGYKIAEDISGIACLPGASEPRRCLVVNDQNTEAQFVTLSGHTLTPRDPVALLGDAPSPATLGAASATPHCSAGKVDFSDLDGEGVAYAAPYFYVVGSHGCSRKDSQFSLSSFILARVRVDASGAPAPGGVETSYRLSDALMAADIVAPYVAQDLQTDGRSNGLNIEGVAVIEDRLFLGLRAPSLNGVAYIVETSVDAVFAPGHDRLKAKPVVIPVKVGEGAGIRDLAVLPDKRLLVLTGPAQKQQLPYELFAVETKPGGSVERLGQLAGVEEKDKDGTLTTGKAEAVMPLGGDRILVLFDSLENGGPREYALPN